MNATAMPNKSKKRASDGQIVEKACSSSDTSKSIESNEISKTNNNKKGVSITVHVHNANEDDPDPRSSGDANNHREGSLQEDHVVISSVKDQFTSQPFNTDKLVAEELSNLTKVQRTLALEDVHGVSDYRNAASETDDFVSSKINEMLVQLSRTRNKSAYEKAVFLCPSYVHNRDFLLMFLRSDYYDVRKASSRLVNYYNVKLELFGLDRLVGDILLEHLSENDMKVLMCGGIHLLPQNDRSGRPILCLIHDFVESENADNMLRAAWYVTMSTMENVDVQRSGIVTVIYTIAQSAQSWKVKSVNFDPSLQRRAKEAVSCLPFRHAAVHFCYDSSRFLPTISLLQLAIGSQGRVRFRAHHGTQMECFLQLKTFGIDPAKLPFDGEGNAIKDDLVAWIENRKKLEQERVAAGRIAWNDGYNDQDDDDDNAANNNNDNSTNNNNSYGSNEDDVHNGNGYWYIKEKLRRKSSSNNNNNTERQPNRIDCPIQIDILLGKGRPYQEYPGNTRLQEIIESKYESYEKITSKAQKTQYFKTLVEEIQAEGTRFLKRSGPHWEEVSEDVARDKVGTSFRNFRKQQIIEKSLTSSRSSESLT